eukprot:6788541-Ditylum_brightwellii.AAC.1
MIENDPMCNIKGNAEKLQERAKLMGNALENFEPAILEGWMGKPKGIKQVVFERGFLELDNAHICSKEGPKDDEEETMLQHMTGKIAVGLGINVTAECTPKCHPELAGEDIEYTWANYKFT